MTKTFMTGIWIALHTMGAHASRYPVDYDSFVKYATLLIMELPCVECRSHAAVYIREHPINNASHPFMWTWDFHNAVNKRIGNPVMKYEDAIAIFFGRDYTKICAEADCTGEPSS